MKISLFKLRVHDTRVFSGSRFSFKRTYKDSSLGLQKLHFPMFLLFQFLKVNEVFQLYCVYATFLKSYAISHVNFSVRQEY